MPLLSEGEVRKRLRDRGEPIKLFGETASETYQRLRYLEMQEPTGSKSQTDFKSAMEKIDQVGFYKHYIRFYKHSPSIPRHDLEGVNHVIYSYHNSETSCDLTRSILFRST